MLFALIFPRAQRVSTYDISAERNVWLQSALRSFAIVCDRLRLYGNRSLCDRLRSTIRDRLRSAIVCDRLRSYGNQPLVNFGRGNLLLKTREMKVSRIVSDSIIAL